MFSSFLSKTKKLFVRFLTFIGALVFISFMSGIIIGMSTDDRRPKLPDDIVLTLELDGGFIEKPALPTLRNPFPQKSSTGTLHQMTRTLDRAANDERVHGLYIHLQSGDYGLAHIQEFRDALNRFKASGKFVYLYSNSFGGFGSSMGEYQIAATADEIWMQPVGTLGLTGYSLEMPFFRGLLDKIGVEPEVISKGKYKSAPETFSRTQSSPENIAMSQSMLTSLFDQFIHDVSMDRDLDPELLKSLIDQSPMTDHDALKAGLVDSVGYWDEFLDHVDSETPEETEDVSLGSYSRGLKPRPKKAPRFALIQVSGAISSFGEGASPMSDDMAFAEPIWDAFHGAMEDEDIRAIIFRVDSPGGSPIASETIRRALILAKKEKPVIVSMGNSAASGGYWISADASAIIAQPATLTGSIGVFAVKPNLASLWEKLGVNFQRLNKGDHADLWSTNKALSETDRKQMQYLIDHTYDQFIERVAQGRNMTPEQARKVAGGFVWTGEQALTNGLIDGLGGLDTAIEKGKTLTEIEKEVDIALVPFPKPLTPVQQFIKLANDGFVAMPGFLKLSSTIDTLLESFKKQAFTPLVK